MAKYGDITLSVYAESTTLEPEILDPFGRRLSYDAIEISRKDRTSNGRLVKDIINNKLKITLNYTEIDGDSLKQYEDFYNLKSELLLTIFNNDSGGSLSPESYIVLMEPIDKRRYKLYGKNNRGMYKNVKIVLEEV